MPVHFPVSATDTTIRLIRLIKIVTPAVVKVVVSGDSANIPVENASVTIYKASTNQAQGVGLTDSLGEYFFVVSGGLDYYVKISAGGYQPYPLPYLNPEVFHAAPNDTTVFAVTLTKHSPFAVVVVTVQEDSTYIRIEDADVVIYDVNTNLAHSRDMTDSLGKCIFFVEPNLPYSLRVAAQYYKPSPPPNGHALPFQVGDSNSVTYRNIVLKKDSISVNSGTISGRTVSTTGDSVAGGLVIAINQSNSRTVSGISGPDGFYVLYNVPEGTYDMEAHLEGWYQATPVTSIGVTAGNITPDVDIELTAVTGGGLRGKITFLASVPADTFDVTLVHPVSHMGIPGLSTIIDGGHNYFIDSIPPGTYIPWASYQNDGYVMDPDWIRKFGLPMLTFNVGDSTKYLDFSVTDAVPVISPTNHPDTLIPVYIATTVPTFKWVLYPSTQEYIVGVYNSYGELIWGGYDTSNNVLHAQLTDSKQDTVVFNFDSSATEPIRWGYTYRWKVWADKGAEVGVQQLISASEDLMGLFTLSEKREPWKGYKKRK
jgi:hypothetical protein